MYLGTNSRNRFHGLSADMEFPTTAVQKKKKKRKKKTPPLPQLSPLLKTNTN
jgi:hypothetical protein